MMTMYMKVILECIDDGIPPECTIGDRILEESEPSNEEEGKQGDLKSSKNDEEDSPVQDSPRFMSMAWASPVFDIFRDLCYPYFDVLSVTQHIDHDKRWAEVHEAFNAMFPSKNILIEDLKEIQFPKAFKYFSF
jgi:hypothetical protein